MTVSLSKKKALDAKMLKLGLLESDIEEKFIRSSGKGGQKVNRTSSCVYLKHLPSGIEVKCQIARTQVENRFFARRILCDKFQSQILKIETQKERDAYKRRKQKKRRSRKAKQKMIEHKRRRSSTKSLRKKVTD